MRPTTLRATAAGTSGFVRGVAGMLGVAGAPAADAYWTDGGTLTSGTVATWPGITAVACPNPAWGTNHVLTWTAPGGGTATVALTTTVEPAVLSFWTQPAPRPGTPLVTTGTTATWGISTINALETTDFRGTWTVTLAAPTGTWTSTRSGTWQIDFASSTSGTAACTVNP